MEEAYAREESSIGWWPASEPPGPAFYAYTYPEPEGFRVAPIRTEGAFFDERYGELMLPWDVVTQAPDPATAALEFFQEAYETGADLAGWDRSMLEPVVRPHRPPTRPWSSDPTTGAARAARDAGSPSDHPNIKKGGPTSRKRQTP
jgi:hypothetical protein